MNKLASIKKTKLALLVSIAFAAAILISLAFFQIYANAQNNSSEQTNGSQIELRSEEADFTVFFLHYEYDEEFDYTYSYDDSVVVSEGESWCDPYSENMSYANYPYFTMLNDVSYTYYDTEGNYHYTYAMPGNGVGEVDPPLEEIGAIMGFFEDGINYTFSCYSGGGGGSYTDFYINGDGIDMQILDDAGNNVAGTEVQVSGSITTDGNVLTITSGSNINTYTAVCNEDYSEFVEGSTGQNTITANFKRLEGKITFSATNGYVTTTIGEKAGEPITEVTIPAGYEFFVPENPYGVLQDKLYVCKNKSGSIDDLYAIYTAVPNSESYVINGGTPSEGLVSKDGTNISVSFSKPQTNSVKMAVMPSTYGNLYTLDDNGNPTVKVTAPIDVPTNYYAVPDKHTYYGIERNIIMFSKYPFTDPGTGEYYEKADKIVVAMPTSGHSFYKGNIEETLKITKDTTITALFKVQNDNEDLDNKTYANNYWQNQLTNTESTEQNEAYLKIRSLIKNLF